jgi:hypothetical protein
MALAFRGREIGVKDTTRLVNVPDVPKARLMYYLDCVSTVSMPGLKYTITQFSFIFVGTFSLHLNLSLPI